MTVVGCVPMLIIAIAGGVQRAGEAKASLLGIYSNAEEPWPGGRSKPVRHFIPGSCYATVSVLVLGESACIPVRSEGTMPFGGALNVGAAAGAHPGTAGSSPPGGGHSAAVCRPAGGSAAGGPQPGRRWLPTGEAAAEARRCRCRRYGTPGLAVPSAWLLTDTR